MKICKDCGAATNGNRCKACLQKFRRKTADANAARCSRCKTTLAKGTKGTLCIACLTTREVATVLTREQGIAPPPLPLTDYSGNAIIISCLHIPFYSVPWVMEICETAQLLHIDTLVLAGDVLMADRPSKYDRVGKTPTIAEELLAMRKVMDALLLVFKRIIFVVGNHDQRIEKQVAAAAETKMGRNTLDMVAAALGTTFDPDDMEALSTTFIESFLNRDRVHFEPLPEITWNNTYRIMHAGSSRTPPSHERAMAAKHRQSIIGGNSHLFGAGFDASGQDLCMTLGHACEPERFRYIREKPTSFPAQVRGMAVILVNERTGPAGTVIPLADHPRWFKIRDIKEALA